MCICTVTLHRHACSVPMVYIDFLCLQELCHERTFVSNHTTQPTNLPFLFFYSVFLPEFTPDRTVNMNNKHKSGPGFQFAIDRGGTFTDIYAKTPSRKEVVMKLLSEDPKNYPDAPREGIRRIMEEVGDCIGSVQCVNV